MRDETEVYMKYIKKTAALILSLMMTLTCIPAIAFADDGNTAEPAPAEIADEAAPSESGEALPAEAETPAEEEEAEAEYDDPDMGVIEDSFGEGVDAGGLDGTDPEEQAENFFFAQDESAAEKQSPARPMSLKGDRLSGNDLKYYNRYKSIISGVAARTRENSYITVKAGAFLGKRTFTAKQLGVKSIGYKKNGTWYVYPAAQKKIAALFDPVSWKRVYTSVLSDLSDDSYWVDWYAEGTFYEWHYRGTFNSSKITFTKDSAIQFRLPVMPEFAKDANASEVYIFKADKTKIASADQAKANARSIVQSFDSELNTTFAGSTDEEIDLNRLWRYCLWITLLTDYDHEAAVNDDVQRTTPWSMISVLDGKDETKAVCAGYARAFKYLCDLSTFKSDWIDCQIVSGTTTDSNVGHMWNIVRMNDGENYVVDPTWIDDGETSDNSWFLRGAPSGTADSYTIDSSYRVYDEWVRQTFAPAERKLSARDQYMYGWEKQISLSKPVIKTPARGKKRITVKWKKVTTPLGALYVDGYQIRYGTKKSMSGAKKVTVKGYSKASKTIKKLRSGKYYYVQVRTFAKLGGKTYYSPWSAKKKVKTR